MAKMDVREALTLWRQAGLLEPGKAEELSQYLERHAPAPGGGRALRIFAGFGAVLVGLGLILFVGSHWPGMSPIVRILTLFLAYGLVVAAAWTAEIRRYPRVAGAMWLLVSLVLGANIILFGQMFNLSLTFWQGPLLWMVGALALAYAVRSRLNAWLAVPLGLLALGWAGGGHGWFTDDQWEFLVSAEGLRALFAAIGLALLSIGLLAQRSAGWRFASGTWITWGALIVAAPLVLGTVDGRVLDWLFRMHPGLKHWLILVASAGLVTAALLRASLDDPKLSALLVGLAIVVLGLPLLGATGFRAHDYGLLFLFYPLAIFSASLLTVWLGVRAQQSGLINIGMGAAAVVVLIQYFSWSFRLLDRALAFVLGGVLLIVLALWIERKRRHLIEGFAP